MIVEFDKSFPKSLLKINSKETASRVKEVIANVEQCHSIQEVKSIKKLKGYSDYYRVRIGDYRIGIKLIDSQTVRFIIIANRKDIYKRFP